MLRADVRGGGGGGMRDSRCTRTGTEKYERGSRQSAICCFQWFRSSDAKMRKMQSSRSAAVYKIMDLDLQMSVFVVWLDTLSKSRVAARGF